MKSTMHRISAFLYISGGMFLGTMFEHLSPDMQPGYAIMGLLGAGILFLATLCDAATP